MKKFSFYLFMPFFGLLCTSIAMAQNTSPFWSLAGNNNATSTSKIGTTNTQTLRIVTNDVTRLFLTTNGNIGVNTMAPRAPIHVNGSGKDTGIYSSAIKYGVVGVNTTSGTYNAGVFGKGPKNGMYAEGGDIGVYAEGGITSGTGIGVFGLSQYGAGVQGQSDGTGVKGQGLYSGVSGFGQSYGVYGEASPGAAGNGWGVYGKGVYGVYGISSQVDTGKGVYGNGVYGVHGEGTTYGVYARGRTGTYSANTGASATDAVRAAATGSASYGINASSASSYGIYARTSNTASYAGFFSGNVYSTGTFTSSDEKLKKNIQPVEDGLSIINKLHPKHYEFRQDGDYAKMNMPGGNQYGLIAQELEEVLPSLVKDSKFDIGRIKADEKYNGNYPKGFDEKKLGESINFKAVNYDGLIPILIKATQELSETVEMLKNENSAIREELARLKNKGVKNEISSSSLLQNVPNPVAGNTTIGYSLPELYSKAQIVLADSKGSIVKQMNVSGVNKGNVQVNVSGFNSGAYTYSLLIDGKTVASKQMIVVK